MSDLKKSFKDITDGKFLPAYLLLGTETLLKEEWLTFLCRKYLGSGGESGTGIRRLEGRESSLPEILADLNMPVLFSEGKRIIIIDDPPYLPPPPKNKKKKAEDEEEPREPAESGDVSPGEKDRDGDGEKKLIKLFQAFWGKQISLPEPDNIIVFRVTEPDKRKQFYRLLSKDLKAVTDCSPLKGEELKRWVNKRLKKYNKKIDAIAYEKLLVFTEGDLWKIDRELAKISDYMQDDEENITEELVEKLVYSGPRGNIFKLVDAMGEGMYLQAYSHLGAMLAVREAPLMILHMIVRQYRLILNTLCLREEGYTESKAAPALGVKPFVARKLYRQAGHYNRRELTAIFGILLETDFNIKMGKMDPETALEVLIGRIAGLKNS